jgi:hypothetical protein
VFTGYSCKGCDKIDGVGWVSWCAIGVQRVTLNQYNVFAYKKVIRGVNVYPDWSEAVQGKFKLDEVTADVSWRITKDGKYLGVVAGYDFKYDHGKAGIRYSF